MPTQSLSPNPRPHCIWTILLAALLFSVVQEAPYRSEVQGKVGSLKTVALGPSVVHSIKDHKNSGLQNSFFHCHYTISRAHKRRDPVWGSEIQTMCCCYKGDIMYCLGTEACMFWGRLNSECQCQPHLRYQLC